MTREADPAARHRRRGRTAIPRRRAAPRRRRRRRPRTGTTTRVARVLADGDGGTRHRAGDRSPTTSPRPARPPAWRARAADQAAAWRAPRTARAPPDQRHARTPSSRWPSPGPPSPRPSSPSPRARRRRRRVTRARGDTAHRRPSRRAGLRGRDGASSTKFGTSSPTARGPILIRLLITLGISLALVSFYHFSGWSSTTTSAG